MVSELNIIQAICGGRPGISDQLEGPSAFLLVPVGGLKRLFWALVPTKSMSYRIPPALNIDYAILNISVIPMGDYDI